MTSPPQSGGSRKPQVNNELRQASVQSVPYPPGAANVSTTPIHHVLHGYRDGHGLIATSTNIPADERRLLDRLSDSPGALIIGDPRGYLTGYPLPTGRYALARSWEAKDGMRPNTVWTHTLLLEPEHLDQHIDLNIYLTMLAGPDTGVDLDFSTPAKRLRRSSTSASMNRMSSTLVAQLCDALFSSNRQVYELLEEASGEEEALTIAIWKLMWPRLRRSFSFCTAAAEPRTLGAKTLLDLQWTSVSQRSKFRALQRAPISTDLPPWAVMLADAVDKPDPQLAEFFAFCGSESALRATLGTLGELYSLAPLSPNPKLGGGADWLSHKTLASSVSVVASEFANPERMRRLKRTMFGAPRSGKWVNWPELTVLAAIFDDPLSQTLLETDLESRKRLSGAWHSQPIETLDLVHHLCSRNRTRVKPHDGEPTVAGLTEHAVLKAIAQTTPYEAMNTLAIADAGLTVRLIGMNKKLADADSLWVADASGVRALRDELAFGRVTPSVAGAMQTLLIEAAICPQPPAGKQPTTSSHLRLLVSGDTLGTIVNFVASGRSCRVGIRETLRESVASLSKDVFVQALRTGVEARAADLVVEVASRAALEDVDVAELLPRGALERAPTEVLVSLTVSALISDEPRPKLLATVLPSVHSAVAQQRLSESSWRGLEARLPSVPPEHEWDRALRLRLEVLVALRRWHLSLGAFRGELEDPELADMLESNARQSKDKKQKSWFERVLPW